MPPTHATEGLQATPVIREELPGTAIIVLSAQIEVDEAMELLADKERLGSVLKSRVTDVTEFIETVERIATAGTSVVQPSAWYRSSSGPADGAIRSTSCARGSARSLP